MIKAGVNFDKQLGHRSCDEAFNLIPRYQHSLVVKDLYFGRIRKGGYLKLLTSMEQKALGKYVDPMDQFKTEEDKKKAEEEKKKKEAEQKKCPSKPKRMAVVFTKPPETILIFHDPEDKTYPYVVFDSHPRSFELYLGAGFYFFNTKASCANHLDSLFPSYGLSLKKEYEAKKYDSYEANYVELRETSDFMTATTYQKKKPIFALTKSEELNDRDVISSLIISQMKKDEEERIVKEKTEKAKKKEEEEEEEKKKKKKKEGSTEEKKEKDEPVQIELSEKKILLDTISTLREELKKTKGELKECKDKLKEQEFINESVNQLNEESKKEVENLKKKNLENDEAIKKIRSVMDSLSQD